MRKLLLFLAASAFILISCGKDVPAEVDPQDENKPEVNTPAAPLIFDFKVNHPDVGTKAVKTGWEEGDVVFVFFSEAKAPNHLEMKYDAEKNSWTATPKNGAEEQSFSLTDGTMTAVYLPFGSEANVIADGTSFKFDKTFYTYYLVAEKQPYTVKEGVVSGSLNMVLPDNYVQFFIEDSEAVDGAYLLGANAVTPVGVESIEANGDITETSDKSASDDMVGYAYQGGYLFSGKADPEVDNHYFAKTKKADDSREDYLVTGKTLPSHSAIKLPANGHDSWQAVGYGITVHLVGYNKSGRRPPSYDLGTWYTCNYQQTVPEAPGPVHDVSNADNTGVLPSGAVFEALLGSRRTYQPTWIPMTIHGQSGVVVKADEGFLFFPGVPEFGVSYWCDSYIFVFSDGPQLLSRRGRGLRGGIRSAL